MRALQDANLGGLDLFEKLAPLLRPLFDALTFQRLQGHVENLEFDQAVSILSGCMAFGTGSTYR